MWITGYYQGNNSTEGISSIPWSKYTHIIHFATQPGPSGTVNQANISSAEASAITAAGHAAGVKVLFTIGDPSPYFNSNTAPGTVATFVSNLVAFMNAHGYDGIDVDWESNINLTQYGDFVNRLRSAIGSGKLITVAAYGGNGNTPRNGVLAAGAGVIDQVNMMCYDLDGFQSVSWYVCNLYAHDNQSGVDQLFNDFTGAGVPASKLGIGMPFYGRHRTGVSAPNQPTSVGPSGFTQYGDLVSSGRIPSSAQVFDSYYGGEYLTYPSEFWPYTGPAQINDIVSWGKSQGVGGFMSFVLHYEYLNGASGDARYPLSSALASAVGRGAAATPGIVNFIADNSSFVTGQSRTLSWSVSGADSLSINNGVGTVTGTSVSVSPSATTTYTLTATNAQGSSTAAVTVTLSANPVISSFGPAPISVASGSSATLSWDVAGATSLSIDNGVGPVTGSSVSVTPSATTTYTLTATNGSGSSTATATITLRAVDPPSIDSFTSSASSIAPGDSATLSFSATGADTIAVDGATQSGSSLSVSPTTTTTFTLTATNSQGTVSQTLTITVRGAAAENVRYHQVRSEDRQGDGPLFQMTRGTAVEGYPLLYDATGNAIGQQPRGNTLVAQLADQTAGFVPGHVLVFDAFGNAKDGGAAALFGAGGSLGQGSWYGQVPRGTRNGSNVTFRLDYTLASPYTILVVNGVTQNPAVDGPGANADPEYSITGNVLTMTHAPKASDKPFYIWYFIDAIAPPPPTQEAVAITVIFSHIPAGATMVVDMRADDDPGILFDFTPRAKITFVHTRASIPTGWQMLISLEQSLALDGTDVLNIFEVFADITNSDGSVTHVVPSVAGYVGDNSGFDPTAEGISVTAVTGDGATATYSYTRASGAGSFSVGNYVTVSGFSTPGFNVTNAQITAVGSGTFSIANTTTGSESIAGSGIIGDSTWYGSIENASNAVDGDEDTFATQTRNHSWPGHQGGGFIFTFDF